MSLYCFPFSDFRSHKKPQPQIWGNEIWFWLKGLLLTFGWCQWFSFTFSSCFYHILTSFFFYMYKICLSSVALHLIVYKFTWSWTAPQFLPLVRSNQEYPVICDLCRQKTELFLFSVSSLQRVSTAPFLFFVHPSLAVLLYLSHTHSNTHIVTRDYSLYLVRSIRCISRWWKVVLMRCWQSPTWEMDIWSSIWPNMTPGLPPDLISLLLGVKVGLFK